MRILFSAIVTVLCATEPSWATHDCENLLREFADRSSKFIQCSIDNGVPFSVCLSCATQYEEFKGIYGNLTAKPENSTQCSDIYFDKDKLNVVPHSFEVLNGYWNQAFCNECFTSDGTVSNETNDFYHSVIDYRACQTKEKLFCDICEGKYKILNNLFNDIEEKHKHSVCFDIMDMMNRTRAEWTKACGHETPSGSLLAFAAVSSTLTSLPILFYIGFFLYYRRMEENYQTLDSQSGVERETTTRNPDPPMTEDLLDSPSTSTGITAEPNTNTAHNKVVNIMDEEEDDDLLS